MKRFVYIILAFVLAMSIMLTGCGEKAPATGKDSDIGSDKTSDESKTEGGLTVSPAGQLPIVDEKVTLTAFIIKPPNVVDIPTNKAVLWLEDQTNVHIEFQITEEEEAENKLNLILSSDSELPDLILMELSHAQQAIYGEQGLIIPLNDLLDKYGFYSKQLLEYVPDGRKQITAPDGNIYGMPALEECYHCTLSQKMWINKTWLDTLGLEMPETTDDFYNVLKAFKEQDPNGNGKADEIPLSGCLDWWHTNVDGFLMNAFIYNDGGNRLNLVDGKVIPAFTQDEWKEGLKYLNMLFVEGLLDPEAFVQGPEQLRQLVENDEAIMLGACPTGTPAAFALDTGEATKNYTCVPPLKGPSGAQNTGYYPSTLWAGAFITKNCKYPEVAFRWLDYLLSEEATIRQVFGEEGVDWRPAQDGEIGLDGNPGLIKEINVLPGMYEQNQGIEILCNINKKIFNGRVVDPNDEWYIEKRLADETKKYEGYEPDEVLPLLFMTVDDVNEYSELQAGINQYVTQSIARFITGDMDIETDWEKYLQELKNMGIDRYIEIVQKTYDSQYKN